ncbi:MAG: hypothetical protein JO255_04755 [Alphaproteobacteria bacterium]|nr:hypothetical protein [Alphaproteobacteria bacterium]
MAKEPVTAALGRIAWLTIAAGGVITLAAIGWWASFYGDVIRGNGHSSLANAFRCLYSTRGVCGVIPGMAHEAGRMAYSPTAFWFGVSLLLTGIALRLILARQA